MRVAVDALNLQADERGMGRYVRPVLRALADHAGVELTLLVRDAGDAAPYHAIVGPHARVASLSTARRRAAYDAVWYPWNGMRFRTPSPSLVTINDDFAFSYPARGFIARRREQGPIAAAVKAATRITTISAWSRDALAERFALDPQRIGVIPLAPDPFFTRGIEQSPFDEPFVLAVGNAESRKNIAFLAELFVAAFPERNVRLVIVGSQDERTQRALRAPGMLASTFATVDDAHLRRLYRTAAVVAVPSIAEGYGLVAAEAQACGAAVIAANTGALPEAVGDAGILLGLEHREAWIDALRELVRNGALNAKFRARSVLRWTFDTRDGASKTILTTLERLVHDTA